MLPVETQARVRRGPRQRGSILLVSMIALTAMLSVAMLTILSVQSEVQTAGADRFEAIALYAAESGGWAGVDFLRDNCDPVKLFSDLMVPNNINPQKPAGIYGNLCQPGSTTCTNPFDARLKAWYEVSILNNLGDPFLAIGKDNDSQVILHVVGHGPNGTIATLEIEVRNEVCLSAFCDADYAQQGLGALNSSGFAEDNPCATDVDASSGTRTMTP
jgi:hypothetical protein